MGQWQHKELGDADSEHSPFLKIILSLSLALTRWLRVSRVAIVMDPSHGRTRPGMRRSTRSPASRAQRRSGEVERRGGVSAPVSPHPLALGFGVGMVGFLNSLAPPAVKEVKDLNTELEVICTY